MLNETLDLSLSGVQDERVTASAAGLVIHDGSGGTVVIDNEPSESSNSGLD